MKKEGFWTSNYNEIQDVQKELSKMKKKIKVYDTTLRDGEQSIGVSINSQDKLIIAKKLAEAGVDRIEAGFPASSEEDKIAVSNIVKEVKNAEIWVWTMYVNELKQVSKRNKYTVCEILTATKNEGWINRRNCIEENSKDV